VDVWSQNSVAPPFRRLIQYCICDEDPHYVLDEWLYQNVSVMHAFFHKYKCIRIYYYKILAQTKLSFNTVQYDRNVVTLNFLTFIELKIQFFFYFLLTSSSWNTFLTFYINFPNRSAHINNNGDLICKKVFSTQAVPCQKSVNFCFKSSPLFRSSLDNGFHVKGSKNSFFHLTGLFLS
jgi:hypothetical protein